ncbi:MAG: hypothetical protein M3R26_02505 [Actinomycetota bacterium]|nr:hypothetical protein [Actinomycetota bacterium]
MSQRLLVTFRTGPGWTGGTSREQPDWDAHAAFIDALVERSTIVMGGPFDDYSGAMLLLEGVGADEVRSIFADDPFVKNGVFVLDEAREWTIFVDALA